MKPESIINFGYTITKPFSRRVCYLLFGFGVLSLAAFSAINVFLVGYDVVTITTSNFNTTQTHSWTVPWESEVNFACEPHQFQLGDSFRTNVSAFSYSISEVQSSDV
ncbi:hypothetical protein C8R44DRAFT_228732 [Mycena epipterygia]|nr:hypothetical protein C8R44DRAFT_228732 [Mycena epipterygia]